MQAKHLLMVAAMAATALTFEVHHTRGDVVTPVTGWVVHNGSSGFSGATAATNSPVVVPADNLVQVMAAFSAVQLINDGDFVTLKLRLTMPVVRAGDSLGANSLNTQLRVGLFNGGSTVSFEDTGMTGFYFEYSNQMAAASYGNARELTNTATNSPLASGNTIGTPPSGGTTNGNSISGANFPATDFELTLTKNGSNVDFAGSISAPTVPYTQAFNILNYAPAAAGFDHTFNRVGFFFGPRVDGNLGTTNANFTAVLNDVTVTTGNVNAIPESPYGILAVAIIMGAVLGGLKLCRGRQRHGMTAQ